MDVKVDKAGPCRKTIRVRVDSADVSTDYEAVLKEFTKAAKLPGFRKGKAPSKVVESHYNEQIIDEVKERTVPRAYRAALEQENVKAVAVVQVDEVSFSKDTGLSFEAIVDVEPEFKLPKYKKLSLKKQPVEVSEEEVQEDLKRLLDSSARYEDAEGRAAMKDDLVLMDFEGTCEGKPVSELSPESSGMGSGKDFWAMLGEPEFVPGLPAAMEGMSIGDKKSVDIHFPDDFRITALAGKDAQYNVELKVIREKKLPEMNEEFFKQFDVNTEDDLKARIRKDLMTRAELQEEARLKDEIVTHLLKKVDCELPQSIVDHETSIVGRNMLQQMAMNGATREQLEAQRDDIIKRASTASADRVKMSYILGRIADEEGIEVSDKDVDERIEAMARRYQVPPARFRADLEKKEGLDSLKGDIRSDKALSLILEVAKIK